MKNQIISKNHIHEVIHAITVLDTDLLDAILEKKRTYQDTTKEIFLERLEVIFKELRKEDNYLIPNNGQCESNECSNTTKKGICFTGNVSGGYIALILETDSNESVTDIYQCHSFCPTSFEIDPTKMDYYIKIYKDEKVDYVKTEGYIRLNALAEKALAELHIFDNTTISFDYLKIWHENYKYLYSKVKGLFLLKNITLFIDYFREIDSICNSEALNKRAKIANEAYDKIIEGEDLLILKWLLKSEKLNNDYPLLRYNLKEVGKHTVKLYPELNIGFNLPILLEGLIFQENYSKTYSFMLNKYTTLSEEELNNTHLLEMEELHLVYSLKFHLDKRGITII